jgi:hypothetical protein
VKHLPSLVIAAALTGLAPAAWAAPAPADPVERCRHLIPTISDGTSESVQVDAVTPVGDVGCRYTNLRVSLSKYQGWTIGSLTIDRLDFKRIETEQLPLTLSVQAEGIYFTPPALPPASAYQSRLIQKPIELTLDYGFDAATDTLTLRDFTFRGERIGHLTVTASLHGFNPDKIDPRNPPSEEILGDMSLNALAVDFDNQGMIEAYALLPALASLPNGDEDPEGAIAAAKTQAMAALVVLTAAGVPKDSVIALGRFIQAMPQPRGPFHLAVVPKPPLTVTELAAVPPDEPGKLAALIKRLNLTVSY